MGASRLCSTLKRITIGDVERAAPQFSPHQRIRFVARLLHELTVDAREKYIAGTEEIADPLWRISEASAATRTESPSRNLNVLLHITVGGYCCVLRTVAVLPGAQVGRVPVPPVVLCVRLLVAVVMLRSLM